MAKKKMTKKQKQKGKKFAEKLKNKPGISNPFALGNWMAKKGYKLKKKKS